MFYDYGIPNCVPDYFLEQEERAAHEWELEMERQDYYERNKAYKEQKIKEGCAELRFYPDECCKCEQGEEAGAESEWDDVPTMICAGWKTCPVFRRKMKESFPDVSWDEICSWFEKE